MVTMVPIRQQKQSWYPSTKPTSSTSTQDLTNQLFTNEPNQIRTEETYVGSLCRETKEMVCPSKCRESCVHYLQEQKQRQLLLNYYGVIKPFWELQFYLMMQCGQVSPSSSAPCFVIWCTDALERCSYTKWTMVSHDSVVGKLHGPI